MIQIAICDDEQLFLEHVRAVITEYAIQKEIAVQCTCFTNGQNFLQSNVVSTCQIAFLDVHFGHDAQNGIEIGKQVKQINPNVILVYISNLIEYAPDGYEVSALGYILKEKWRQTLPKYLDRIVNQYFPKVEYLEVEKDGMIDYLSLADITYIESLRHEIIVHTTHIETAQYKVNGTLQQLEEELLNKGFVRAHKSYLVNMRMVTDFKNYTLVMNHAKCINVNSRNWKSVTNCIIQWRAKL